MPLQGLNRKVLIIGAGFSGLTSAYYLNKAGFEIEILEIQSTPGGLIRHRECESGLVETAANGVMNSRLFEDLCEEIGCTLLAPKKEGQARFLERDGKVSRWPLSIGETVSAMGIMFKYFSDRETLEPESGESLRAWSVRNLGEDLGPKVLETALNGIYAGDSCRLSATLLLQSFFANNKEPLMRVTDLLPSELDELDLKARKAVETKLKRERRKKLKHKGTVSPEGGMFQFIEKLTAHLKSQGVKFHFGVRAIPSQMDAQSKPILIATSLPQAKELVEGIDPDRAKVMAAVPMLPLISVTNFYKSPPDKKGFGVLFQASAAQPVLGVLMNSSIFEKRLSASGQAVCSETWILGGAFGAPDLLQKSDPEILGLIAEQRRQTLGSAGDLVESVITRWPQALPHYTRDLERRLPYFQENRNNVFLLGNYLGKIGLLKILERASQMPFEIAKSGHWS